MQFLIEISKRSGHRPCDPLGNQSRRTLLEGNPCSGFPSNARFALCLLSNEHLTMNQLEGSF